MDDGVLEFVASQSAVLISLLIVVLSFVIGFIVFTFVTHRSGTNGDESSGAEEEGHVPLNMPPLPVEEREHLIRSVTVQ